MNKENKMFSAAAVIGILLLVFAFLPSCGPGQKVEEKKESKEEKVIRIGANLVLSGNVAYFGENIKNSMIAAAEEINAAGGIDGEKVELIFRDNQKNTQRNISVFRELVDLKKVPVVISMLSPLSVPLRSLADANKVVLISTIVSYPEFTRGYKYVVRDFISSDIESRVMAEYMVKEKGLKKVACLYVDDDYGDGAFRVLKAGIEEYGGELAAAEAFAQDTLDFRDVVQKILKKSPQAFYIVGREHSFAAAIKQIKEAGFKGDIFTCISLNSANVLNILGDDANGVYFTNIHYYPGKPSNEIMKRFVGSYKEKFGVIPNYLAVYGYDIMFTLKKAIERSGHTPEQIIKGLTGLKLNSIRGEILLGEDRDVQSKVDICQVRDGKFTIIK